jgi:hypothetical protein
MNEPKEKERGERRLGFVACATGFLSDDVGEAADAKPITDDIIEKTEGEDFQDSDSPGDLMP